MADLNDQILQRLVALMTSENYTRFYDHGCGDADLLGRLHAALPGASLTGVDYFSRFGEHNPLTKPHDGLHLIDRQSEEFDQLTATYDVVFSSCSLHHFKHPVQELRLMMQKVAPGGRLVLCDFAFVNDARAEVVKNISSFVSEMKAAIKGKYHRHHYTLDEAEDLICALDRPVLVAEVIPAQLSDAELQETLEHSLHMNQRAVEMITANAGDFWQDVWLPFIQQDTALLQKYGCSYNHLLWIEVQG